MSLISRTNGTVIVDVENGGSQQFEMLGSVVIEYRDLQHPDDYFRGEVHQFTNDGFTLSRGSHLRASFPAPTNRLDWRAHIAGYGQRQIAVKTSINKALKHAPLLTLRPFAIYPEYAQTGWITQ
jgi:hypothetical protein